MYIDKWFISLKELIISTVIPYRGLWYHAWTNICYQIINQKLPDYTLIELFTQWYLYNGIIKVFRICGMVDNKNNLHGYGANNDLMAYVVYGFEKYFSTCYIFLCDFHSLLLLLQWIQTKLLDHIAYFFFHFV